MRQQIYQDAYCSRVHLEDINSDIEMSTSATEDEDGQSASSVGINRELSTSSSQRGLGMDITGEDEDVAHSSSSKDANSIPSQEGRDDETVNDVLEIVQMIDAQPFR